MLEVCHHHHACHDAGHDRSDGYEQEVYFWSLFDSVWEKKNQSECNQQRDIQSLEEGLYLFPVLIPDDA